MSSENADEQLRNIGKAPNRFAVPPGEKKRRPGRPRKNKEPIVEEPEPAVDFEIGEDPDDVAPPAPPPSKQRRERPRITEAEDDEPQEEKPPAGEKDTMSKRLEACSIIGQLKKRLNAVGSGMTPNADVHTLYQLQKEIELLNSQINASRGDNSFKTLAIAVVAPAVSAVVSEVFKRIDAEKTVDLTGYDREVADNWDVLFADAAAQISINNPTWFAASPWAVMFEGAVLCGVSTNMKNAAAAKQQGHATEQ